MSKFFALFSAAVIVAGVMLFAFSWPFLTICSITQRPSHWDIVVGPCWRRSAHLSPLPRLYATASSFLNCWITAFFALNGRKFENDSRRFWIASPPDAALRNGLTVLA